nr:beta-1,3-galactosyltransferase brn-like [Danaus plexippus plexippus]
MRKKKCIYIVVVVVFLYYVFGVDDYIHARSYDKEFDYPLSIDIRPLVDEVLAGKKPSLAPINFYPYRFLSNSGKCTLIEKIDLFIIVKSAMNNFERRDAIRQTYGMETFNQGIVMSTMFFVGVDEPKSATQRRLEHEMADFKDIIQVDFQDTYDNNTIKTMMSFRWLYEHCPIADFYFFTDDDMYVSVKNLLEYLKEQTKTKERDPSSGTQINVRDSLFYAGYMFHSSPQRFRSSKWRITLEEYPFDRWPPYITAGAYVVSNRAMKVMYAASLFVKNFRFDDIYLGIVAKKANIPMTHCPRIYFYKKSSSVDGYKDVIASHGFHDPEVLMATWRHQHLQSPHTKVG